MIQVAGPKTLIISLFNILAVVCDSPVPPNIVTAEVMAESDVIRLPLESFQKLKELHPITVTQLIQVAMARLQRVSFLTLNKYFGLTTELLKNPEAKKVADSTLANLEEPELSQQVAKKICEVIGVEDTAAFAKFITYGSYEEGDILIEKDEPGAGIMIVIEVCFPRNPLLLLKFQNLCST